MTHIELSLSPLAQGHSDGIGADPLERWAAAAAAAEESCLVVDARGVILARSRAFARMFAIGQPTELVGRHVLDVLYLVDFTAAGNELGEPELEQIAPLLAINSGRPARGVIRVRLGSGRETLDAMATPIRRAGEVVGSLSFFAAV